MSRNNPLVSIIMPVYNTEKYVGEAIQSVLEQSYANWELLIINDGSTDNSEEIIFKFSDKRIHYFKQKNKGVSAARNVGIKQMKGNYICFLDADDIMPQLSLMARLSVFKRSQSIEFVDGKVKVFDSKTNDIMRLYAPTFEGKPFNELIALSESCFFGPSWMIRIIEGRKYHFEEKLTHGEDLLFYMNLARSVGDYSFTKEVVLNHRKHSSSAMSNLSGLNAGYKFISIVIEEWPEVSSNMIRTFRKRYKRMMLWAYLKEGDWVNAFRLVW